MKKLLALAVLVVLAAFPLAAEKKSSLFSFQEGFSQSGTLASTALFTPTADSDYQACIYLENITPNTGSVQATVSWTDDRGVQSHSVTGTNSHGECFPIHDLASDSVSVDGTDFGNSQTYTIYITAIGQ